MRGQTRHRSGRRHYRTDTVTWGEFDAHLRRFDERLDQTLERIDARFAAMDKRAAATEKRIEQLSGEMNRGFDRLSAEMDRGFRLERERVDVQFAALHERQRLNHEEIVEARRETRSLKWNIWIAACATAVALASLNATMTSGIISAFESGRNMAAASAAQVDRTTTPQRQLPLYRREDAGDTLEDNQPQS